MAVLHLSPMDSAGCLCSNREARRRGCVVSRIIVGVSGASGAPYAASLLEFLHDRADELDLQVRLVFSQMGRSVWKQEVGTDPRKYGFEVYSANEPSASFVAGSAPFEGMAIVPCSAAAMGRIAHGVSHDLLGQAADIALKELRPLVLVVRETPLSLIHLRNMVRVTEAGAVVMPPCPSFFGQPKTVANLVDTVTARIVDHLGIEH